MGNSNQKGQILVEVALVFLLVILIFFAAFSHLSQIKAHQQKFQFTKESPRGKASSTQVRY